jgi:DNA-binding PadR family transcriptional regulator
MQPIGGDSLRGHLETMILSVLEQGEAHGFEVWRRLEDAGCGALSLKEGSLYPALYRLEENKLVKAQWEAGNSERRGPRRRNYRLTPKGRRKLSEGRQQWSHFTAVIGAIVGAPS